MKVRTLLPFVIVLTLAACSSGTITGPAARRPPVSEQSNGSGMMGGAGDRSTEGSGMMGGGG